MKRLCQVGNFQEEKSCLLYMFEKCSQLRQASLRGNHFGGTGGFLFLFDSEPWEEGRNLSLTTVNA